MFIWDDIAAILTIASVVSAAFNYIVIRPLQSAIAQNNSLLGELKHELERSAADRRGLDKRISALEAAHNINKERLVHLEEAVHRLESTK